MRNLEFSVGTICFNLNHYQLSSKLPYGTKLFCKIKGDKCIAHTTPVKDYDYIITTTQNGHIGTMYNLKTSLLLLNEYMVERLGWHDKDSITIMKTSAGRYVLSLSTEYQKSNSKGEKRKQSIANYALGKIKITCSSSTRFSVNIPLSSVPAAFYEGEAYTITMHTDPSGLSYIEYAATTLEDAEQYPSCYHIQHRTRRLEETETYKIGKIQAGSMLIPKFLVNYYDIHAGQTLPCEIISSTRIRFGIQTANDVVTGNPIDMMRDAQKEEVCLSASSKALANAFRDKYQTNLTLSNEEMPLADAISYMIPSSKATEEIVK